MRDVSGILDYMVCSICQNSLSCTFIYMYTMYILYFNEFLKINPIKATPLVS